MSTPQSHGDALRRALVALERMQAKLDAAEAARRAPVAIVGIGCRFPGGADGPDAFWRLLVEGRDAVAEVPADRWDADAFFDPDPDAPGAIASRHGAFIAGIDRFDPAFFGITPREAEAMDPQQRLLLEVAWEALENAGIAPDRLGGSATGVWVGVVNADYELISRERGGLDRSGPYFASGNAQSVVSGRLSYLLGLSGPSVSIDTACSSSLVAVQQAVQSLRSGETRLAIAGGVNAVLSPESSIAISRYRMLAPDGRCKTFDARADGFARGEGCGIVVLKRLADAVADGDRVIAVIRGAAVNQDGASTGLTAPSGPAQEAVIRAALADAGVRPIDVGYVEAHGTGTSLGDPVEVGAIAAALGADRAAERPVLLGSVKTNLGHLESAAGIAGLIKLALCLQHGRIPPHLHLREPNPLIPWSRLPVRVPVADEPWPEGAQVGGVSSFGFSGTNAHILLSAQAPTEPEDARPRPFEAVPLSGRTADALRDAATRLKVALEAEPHRHVGEIAHTLGAGRAHGRHRLAVRADSTVVLRDGLADWLAGEPTTRVFEGVRPAGDPPRVAFLFTGQGAQYPGMGRGLYAGEPVFRDAIDRCDERLRPRLGHPLADLLFPAPEREDEARRLLDRTRFTQPALFALEWALAETWRAWGIRPHAVLGHSVGEYVAACVAGVFSLEDGLDLIAERAALMDALPDGGGMAAVLADADTVAPLLEPAGGRLSIAAVNGPANTVVSGDADALDALRARLAERGIEVRPLRVSHAFHSARMEPMLGAFEEAAARVRFQPPRMRLVSNLTGEVARADEVTRPGYWVRHLREPVRFMDGVRALQDAGVTTFMEIGPGATLIGMAADSISSESGTDPAWIPSLRRGRDDEEMLADAVAALHAAGVDVDWEARDAGRGYRPVPLPTYPFQRERYWIDGSPRTRRGRAIALHPLLGSRLLSPLSQAQFTAAVSADEHRWIADHRVGERVILPAAGLMETAVAAADHLDPVAPMRITDLVIREAVVFEAGEPVEISTVVEREGEDTGAFRIHSSRRGDDWRLHATGRLVPDTAGDQEPVADVGVIIARCEARWTAADHRARMEARGLRFGPTLHGLVEVHRRDGEAIARIVAPDGLADVPRYRMHPALLDACLQAIAAALPDDGDPAPYLPLALDGFRLHRPPEGALWSHVRVDLPAAPRPATLRADVRILDDEGQTVARVDGLALRRGAAPQPRWSDWIHRVEWRDVDDGAGRRDPLRAAVDAADATLAEVSREPQLRRAEAALPRLESIATRYVADAFRVLGVEFAAGVRYAGETVPGSDRVLPRHRRLLRRMWGMLEEDGTVRRGAEGWEVVRDPAADHPADVADVLSGDGAAAPALALLQACGPRLAAVLQGEIDPLALLFPDGSTGAVDRLYRDAPRSRAFNRLIAETVAQLAGDPTRGELRVLEIGAGTGATTSAVLPRLPSGRTRYHFTDISPAFLVRARETFAGRSDIEFGVLDIEREPGSQGFDPGSFDIVLAVNVLHATADLESSLRNARTLLRSGGALVVVEAVVPERWIDVTFGLTEGWWRFTDAETRGDHPLVPTERWQAVFAAAGLDQVTVAPSPVGAFGQGIILGRNPRSPARRGWVVVGDVDGIGTPLADGLRSRGDTCVLLPDDADQAAIRGAVDQVSTDAPSGLVYLAASAIGTPSSAGSLIPLQRRGVGHALSVVQALAGRGGAAPKLWLVTRGAQPEAGGEAEVVQAPVSGLATVLRAEHPEFATTTVDLDPRATPAHCAAVLLRELDAGDSEPRTAWRDGRRLAARLARAPIDPIELPGVGHVSLRAPGDGVLEGLEWVESRPSEPGEGEVRIRVRATGLNFRDVMNALAMRSDDDPLGGEVSGTVEAVGAGVSGLAVGDEVVAVAAGGFASTVVVPAPLVVPLPPALNPVVAAGQPLAFLTAYESLHRVGRLAAGERVLIHAAAGGVGLAAVRLALHAGAQVLATAGSAEKRDMLLALGVAHVFDSRSLEFVEGVRAATDGRGVDLALNSLAGEFIPATLDAVARGGRFMEIGKRDAWSAAQVAERRPDLEYHRLDLAERLAADPASVAPVLSEALGPVWDGVIEPLPVRVFPAAGVGDAFRFMAQARHIGKIVVEAAGTEPDAPRGPRVRADGSYLITGGLGGLGVRTARWLVDAGARALVLVGRSEPSEQAVAEIARLERDGARVLVLQADVSRAEEVSRLLASVRREMPPIRGIVHAAGVLDDGALIRMPWDRFAGVLAPKVDGAWFLDRMTREDPVEMFVLFSSIAAILGSAGQGNHAAANAFLDALAAARRADGLHGLSIGWGYWADVGSAAERGIGARLAEQGAGEIDPDAGIDVLAHLIHTDATYAAVQPMDWSRYPADPTAARTWLAEVMPSDRGASTPSTRGKAPSDTETSAGRTDQSPSARDRIAASPAAERREVLRDHVHDQVARVIGLAPGRSVDLRAPLSDLGVDSLMAVELRNRLATTLGLDRPLPATLVFDHPTIEAITTFLEPGVLTDRAAADGVGDGSALIDRVEDLSDEEIERMFAGIEEA
jgi:acyl transferase domain-containing protein